ncbi:MAG: diguanylate cyclase domain-containing protein [Vulcanimicrobiaceae bacterium]
MHKKTRIGDRLFARMGVVTRATQESRDLETRVLTALGGSESLALIAVRFDGCVAYWNRAAEALLGWSAREVLGRQLPAIPAEARDEFADSLRRVEEGESFSDELAVRRRDRSKIELALRFAPVIGERDEVEAALLVADDVTVLNRAKRTGERLLAVTEAALRLDVLPTVLNMVVDVIEQQAEDLRAVIQLRTLEPHHDPGCAGEAGTVVQPIWAFDATRLGSIRVVTQPHRSLTIHEVAIVREAAGLAALILERYRDRDQLRHLALHDPLTGLPNRLVADDRLEQARAQARASGGQVGILLIDLDKFKAINDGFGHLTGDAILQHTTQRLSACLRAQDTLARLGGDEFMAILPAIDGPAAAERVARRMLQACADAVDVDGREVAVSISIGITCSHGTRVEPLQLRIEADRALYRDKASGGTYVLAGAP